jgi:DNA-binding transcriptional ArsR family regulator
VELAPESVAGLVGVAKALSDPVRLQIVDVLRRQAGDVCVCDLESLFDISQPTLSHHLKKLREAGVVGSVKRRPVEVLLRDARPPGGLEIMADLTATDPTPTSSCCSTEAQATCCEPAD